MLNKLKKTDNKGFTIIEVMIVLAIAGLILLIVLLAVPALERNARNTTVKNDVSAVSGGISTFESDNNGTVPTSVAGTGTVLIKAATGISENTTVNGSTVVVVANPGGNVGGAATAPIPGTIDAVLGKECAATGSAYTTGSTSSRSIALYYVTETSGSNILECAQG
jgi:prepilin-type N-terminal cleavage/methylation domain-containing protein